MTNPGGNDERNGLGGGSPRPGANGPVPSDAVPTTRIPVVPPNAATPPASGPGTPPAPPAPSAPAGPNRPGPASSGTARSVYQPLSGRPVEDSELAAEADRGGRSQSAGEDPVQIQRPAAAAAAAGTGTGGNGPDGPGGDGPGGDGPDGPDGPDGGGGPDEPQDGDDDTEKKGLRGLVSGSLLRRVLTGGVAGVALIMVLAVLAFLIGYWRTDVPQPGEIPTNQVATIVMKDGNTPLARVVPTDGNREIIPAQDIPEVMKNAIMAAEDRDFATNPGFSLKGFARAVFKRIPGVADDGEDAGGGSTITQQYVKNALVGDESSLVRKWKELIVSTKMSNSWSKDEIMSAYLNTIYFGRGAYGLQAASKAYFNVNAKDLKVEQAALLAGLVRGPSLYEPSTKLADATGRWNYVLDGMVAMKTVDPAQRQKLQFPRTVPPGKTDGDELSAGPNGLIKTQVLRELADAGIDESTLSTQGLKITTTIDAQAQNAAVKAAKNMAENQPKDLRTAIVSVDPKTGGVLAYYGGDDGNGYDRVQAGLQTGSSFKVFALVAALQQGIPLSRVYSSAPLKATGVTVTNSEGLSCGSCNLATAMKMSLNTVYYRLMMDLNNQARDVADAAHKAGIAESFGGIKKTLEQTDGTGVEGGVVLGQYQSRPIDMASGYATLAAEGVYRKPHLITKVTTADGRTLLDRANDPGERRFSKDVAANTTAALQPIASYSNGNGLAGGRASAAKTGTAQYQDTGQNKDAWMVGYTPSISTAVWVGNDEGKPITNSWGGIIYGSGVPSTIWKQTMDGALSGTDYESFPTPGAIGGQAGVPVETRVRTSVQQTGSAIATSGSGGGSGAETSGTSATRTVPGLPGVPMPTFPWDPTTTQPGGAGNPTGQGPTRPRPGGGAPGGGDSQGGPRVTNPAP
ncbi:transglycosylase domain-containing protein [Tsukamurella serpentis]